ncbi:hypothetical protein C8P63_13222 [Melghirimyces profundicolus]|uniref:Uncharacterized protein n=1 Tax=Melghirimyces profundicolus TaxID=1242148 RepID=A0A2T6B7B7_9BACL|nr:hypothetical protein [Melghirimyces profundicolus]PTX51943.1 hypothetical protein C8P63_13222 [Melghirimyces profundicolus]
MHQPLELCQQCGNPLNWGDMSGFCDHCSRSNGKWTEETAAPSHPEEVEGFREGDWVSFQDRVSNKEMLGWIVDINSSVIRVNTYDRKQGESRGLHRISPDHLKRIGIRLNKEERRALRRQMIDLALLTKDKEWWDELQREEAG